VPDPRPTLLLIRPELQSRRFADEFCTDFGADWPIVVSPLLEIVIIAAPIPAAREIIFTSENAVGPFVAHSPAAQRRAWCVGPRTARAAADAGFQVRVGPGNAEGLLPLILAERPAGRLLYVRGRHAASDLENALISAGIEAESVVVYEQEARVPTPEAAALLCSDAPVLVPLFSPRSARLFAQAATDAQAELRIAAISAAAAEPVRALRNARIIVAAHPDSDGVLAVLKQLARLA
jgi:uroporphyrinogen-III synthase